MGAICNRSCVIGVHFEDTFSIAKLPGRVPGRSASAGELAGDIGNILERPTYTSLEDILPSQMLDLAGD